MMQKGPHISLPPEHIVSRVLGLTPGEFAAWPEAVRDLALALAQEMFLVRYNPFIDPRQVVESVKAKFRREKPSLSREYGAVISKAIKRFWKEFEDDQRFKKELSRRLLTMLDADSVDARPSTLVESSTDSTDLRMNLPLLVVTPKSTEQIQAIVKLANEMDFVIVPRGGGSGLTGGAIPAHQRSVILSLAKCKEIIEIDAEQRTLCTQAGVITLQAIQAAAKKGLLFTVDPASKAASSIGGNISENSGGPFAFEYGTTLDNILSYRMVTPVGEVIEVRRVEHPRHKIMSDETAVFEVRTEDGRLKETISLPGDQIRGANLGKDVTNKYLGGLPGVQKEGVDGVITDACFICYPMLAHARVIVLEFFGRSMHHAMEVVTELVALRGRIRDEGDLVKMSALEEFGIKYVQAIEYVKKSTRYEGDPISVLILELNSDHPEALDKAVAEIAGVVDRRDNMDVFIARDEKEAEHFWEDRHKLSAISKRTSGFKINEDVVIPIEMIPTFADFLEGLNLIYLAKAYRKALGEVGRLEAVPMDDEFIAMERGFCQRILKKETTAVELNDQELEVQISFFFRDLASRYPEAAEKIAEIHQNMLKTRVVVANHMHAGDGNCHVNIPVNSNDPEMLHQAEEAAATVMAQVLEFKGQVSGEHGIGITKIGFISDEKIAALKKYKKEVDPNNILNTGKLTQRALPVTPYTFSFNRLIQDIRQSGLPEKERLIRLLQSIQVCTRCGKCKQVCAMFQPQRSLIYHPRNKFITLGALVEAIYYTQVNKGEPDRALLDELRRLMEHCTACGKCTATCPVKIDTPNVVLSLRAFLDDKHAGGHPIKHAVLGWLSSAPARRVPKAARLAAIGGAAQSQLVRLVPPSWRRKIDNPLFSGPTPQMGIGNLLQALHMDRGPFFIPAGAALPKTPLEKPEEGLPTVLYFPGCGASLFYRSIGLAGVLLLLEAGYAVVLPREHLCCGYPLLVSGCEEAFATNQARNIYAIKKLLEEAATEGLHVTHLLTSCGSCRDGLSRYQLDAMLPRKLAHQDVTQFLLERIPPDRLPKTGGRQLLYHGACHAEWTGIKGPKATEAYRQGLARLTGAQVAVSPGCCGESGLGAMTSPDIYNRIRAKKQEQLGKDLTGYPAANPIIVGCPSCKVGISRSLLGMHDVHPVLHSLEYLAEQLHGPRWSKLFRKTVAKAMPRAGGVRRVAAAAEK
ncbi:FAD-binding and (Fe-S)-binding domain-containing protein [Megalodesulfovibrio gigas]|uniref:Putative FAD linked oxidase domain-containing protein n=1 Tax=Megalodesulfovibrio gigas (strain ATCC 19364 / DSM 1382 / NCIMB 9332 / VKM B-1759) TaxID=1121448 RepID=T2GAJ1_MEGG1|nr:FAD-binding and (Fe-S)-binding domain-containing protein [Megalodesulfovibrio gigas]AGW13194.1 putative FAD linked oxidase domain-containing protein [Megalodesulfovibrio gigas DSM 1382 = ATCC 19364]